MRARLFVGVLAVLFFFVPVVLQVAGVKAHPFENRPLAEYPSVEQGWDALDQGTRYFVDRLPLREQAVRANTWISEAIFSTTPNYALGPSDDDALPFGGVASRKPPAKTASPGGTGPIAPPPAGGEVIAGRDGWLHLVDELQKACRLFEPWQSAMPRWATLAAIVRRSGRQVVIVVAPDKSTIYPETLPASYPQRRCAATGHAAAWAALKRWGGPQVADTRTALIRAKRQRPQLLYYQQDSHWNQLGAAVAVQAALDELGGPVRVRSSDLDIGERDDTGDLALLLGKAATAKAPSVTVRRAIEPSHALPDDLPDPGTPGGGEHFHQRRALGGEPLLRGRTLLVRDSFGVALGEVLEAYTEEYQSIAWLPGTTPRAMIDAIDRADTVVLQVAERDLNARATVEGWVTPRFLDALVQELTPRR